MQAVLGTRNILFSAYYTQITATNKSIAVPSNVVICDGPDLEISYEKSVGQAKAKFHTLFPGMQFLPPEAPQNIDSDEDLEDWLIPSLQPQ